MDSEAAYYSMRAGEERVAAARAAHPNARRVHLELAEAYEFRVTSLNRNAAAAIRPLVPAAEVVLLEQPIILRQ